MNIIAERTANRDMKIAQIVNSIKSAKIPFDYPTLIIATMEGTHIARRTAIEYIDVALYKLGMKKEDLK